MSDIVSTPVRPAGNLDSIENLRQIREDAAYKITTKRGSVYVIYRDPNPHPETPAVSSKAFIIAAKDGAEGVAQYAHAIVKVGEEWEIHPGHKTSPIKSIEPTPMPS